MRALYNKHIPLMGFCRALIPSFPTKNQGDKVGMGAKTHTYRKEENTEQYYHLLKNTGRKQNNFLISRAI